MRSVRTDLAMEVREWMGADKADSIPGVEAMVNKDDSQITITRVKITSAAGESAIGKPCGEYITLEAPELKDRDPVLEERVSHCMAGEIEALLGEKKDDFSALVVGLGNWSITPDSLGPKVTSNLMVTRHLLNYLPEQVDDRVKPMSVLSPGVLGTTGIETGEIVQGVVERLKPSVVFIIDSLASRKTQRISTSLQISNSGIQPGSGLGNRRMVLDSETLGVPVIAIGVPLVVYATTIVKDGLLHMSEDGSWTGSTDEQMLDRMVNDIVAEHFGDMVVTPKDIDIVVDDVARMVANGLNLYVHQGISMDEINRFMH